MIENKTLIGQLCFNENYQNDTLFIIDIISKYHQINSNLESNGSMLSSILEYFKSICASYNEKQIKRDSDLLIVNLIKHFYPIILVFGILGNFVTFLTMLRIYNRRKNFQKFCFSLAALALADLFVLLVGCLREFLEIVLNYDIRSSSQYSCKIVYFACYLFSCFSVYLHGFIAIERWHAVSDPIKSKAKFTFRINKIIIMFIFFTCLIINLPLLWFPTLVEKIQFDNSNWLGIKEVSECEVTNELIFLSIDSVFYCLIPFLITILFSSLTIIKLIQSKTSINKSNETQLLRQSSLRDRERSFFKRNTNLIDSARFKSSINYDIKHRSFQSIIYSSASAGTESTTQSQTSANRKQLTKIFSASSKPSSSNLKITIMLLALPISYLITTFPIFVIIINGFIMNRFNNVSTNFGKAYAIAKIFMYVNNSINILIYILFGKSLRNDFLAILPFKSLFNKLKLHHTDRNQNEQIKYLNQTDITMANANQIIAMAKFNNNCYN